MSKERTRRYRERLAQDEARHEEILRERRRKYQEKKAKGEIKPRNISSLPKHKRAKLREEWKKSKARCRKEEDLAAIFDIPSPEEIDVSFSPVHLSSAHGFISPIPSPPQKMPLSSNEKSARHRAKVNADPVARARYLAKRRESYQRRKREGKTRHPAVSELSKERQAELRLKWRRYQRSHRNKVRNLPLQSCSPVEMNSQWLQDFAPYSPSSELDSSYKQESPMSSHSWVKQEPEPEMIQWENMSSLPAPNHTEQDNSAASTVTPPSMEGLPSSAVLTITKLQCLLESKQERIEALERQVQDLQEDRRFLRSQIENLTSALSTHVCRGLSGESTGNS